MNWYYYKEKYKHWKYKNTFFLIVSLVILYFIAGTSQAENFINKIGDYGYWGAFFTGIFFVSTFTVAPSVVVLYNLAEVLNPVPLALLAGLGAMVGDFLIFRFLKDRVFEELKPAFLRIARFPGNLFQTPFFAWLPAVVGALLIASPLPDEIGIGLLGISRMRNWQFFLLSFALNSVGIFVVVTLARLI